MGWHRLSARLKATAIPVAGRIVAIADTFDAITSDRPYRRSRSVHVALATIREEANYHFEPRLVAALERIVLAEPDYAAPSSTDANCA